MAAWVACTAVPATLLIPRHGQLLFNTLTYAPNPLVCLLHQRPERATFFHYAAGLCAFAIMLMALMASDVLHLREKTRAARAVRLIADSTFTLYLIHYPLLLLARSLRLYRVEHTTDKLLLIAAIVTIAVIAAIPIDRLKQRMRRALTRWMGRPQAAVQSVV